MLPIHFDNTQIAVSLPVEIDHGLSQPVLFDKVVDNEFGGGDRPLLLLRQFLLMN
jgi:hypothetical protein